jgi:hypothetical protein
MVGAGGAAKKWIGLVAGMWVEASAGNAYTFAFYSPKLKHVLHYHQFQLNNLGVAKDIGENVGLLAGALCNSLPPWVMLSIGATTGFIGYGMLWLVVSQQIAPLPYWQVQQTSPKPSTIQTMNLYVVFCELLFRYLTFFYSFQSCYHININMFVCRDCRCVYSNVSERIARPGSVPRSLLHACATSRTAEAQWPEF